MSGFRGFENKIPVDEQRKVSEKVSQIILREVKRLKSFDLSLPFYTKPLEHKSSLLDLFVYIEKFRSSEAQFNRLLKTYDNARSILAKKSEKQPALVEQEESLFRFALEKVKKPKNILILFSNWERDGDWDQIIKHYDQLPDRMANDPTFVFFKAKAKWKKKDYDHAILDLKMLEDDGNRTKAYLWHAQILREQGRYTEEREILEEGFGKKYMAKLGSALIENWVKTGKKEGEIVTNTGERKTIKLEELAEMVSIGVSKDGGYLTGDGDVLRAKIVSSVILGVRALPSEYIQYINALAIRKKNDADKLVFQETIQNLITDLDVLAQDSKYTSQIEGTKELLYRIQMGNFHYQEDIHLRGSFLLGRYSTVVPGTWKVGGQFPSVLVNSADRRWAREIINQQWNALKPDGIAIDNIKGFNDWVDQELISHLGVEEMKNLDGPIHRAYDSMMKFLRNFVGMDDNDANTTTSIRYFYRANAGDCRPTAILKQILYEEYKAKLIDQYFKNYLETGSADWIRKAHDIEKYYMVIRVDEYFSASDKRYLEDHTYNLLIHTDKDGSVNEIYKADAYYRNPELFQVILNENENVYVKNNKNDTNIIKTVSQISDASRQEVFMRPVSFMTHRAQFEKMQLSEYLQVIFGIPVPRKGDKDDQHSTEVLIYKFIANLMRNVATLGVFNERDRFLFKNKITVENANGDEEKVRNLLESWYLAKTPMEENVTNLIRGDVKNIKKSEKLLEALGTVEDIERTYLRQRLHTHFRIASEMLGEFSLHDENKKLSPQQKMIAEAVFKEDKIVIKHSCDIISYLLARRRTEEDTNIFSEQIHDRMPLPEKVVRELLARRILESNIVLSYLHNDRATLGKNIRDYLQLNTSKLQQQSFISLVRNGGVLANSNQDTHPLLLDIIMNKLGYTFLHNQYLPVNYQ